jgi:hypothetical protein
MQFVAVGGEHNVSSFNGDVFVDAGAATRKVGVISTTGRLPVVLDVQADGRVSASRT